MLMENSKLGEKHDYVLIRDFRKSDLSDLLDLLPRCFAREFEFSGFDPDHVTDMVNSAFGRTGRLVLGLLRLSRREPLKFLVAEADGRVVGTTIITDRGRFGYLSAVMVHPDHRKKGIATKLVTDALDYLRRRKKERAVLHAESTNNTAISVYVKLGFNVFEHSRYFMRETDSVRVLEPLSGVKIRESQRGDLDQVYDLARASEDPNHLRIFDFTKKSLKTSLLERIFRLATRKKLVALLDDRLVGYIEAVYTTPKEAASIGSVYVSREGRSLGVEKLLVEAASNEIAKGGAKRIQTTVPLAKQELTETLQSLGFREALAMDAMVAEF
jgi:ribosomal protein S18 acetylase RimI-like enzyme